ncbi:MAG: aminotransferase class V-fold PLP-dependent enzyme [Bryobacteraceae bacterium]|nr:aminotransferase class V-fold PLP-dependent enzyme [Bryobacteraceae bacterium]
MDWAAVRAEFPALANWTYLNAATFGQLPVRATQAVQAHFAHRDELASADFLTWFDDADRLRGKLGCLFGATADDICFIPATAHALSWLMHGIPWQAGDEIVALSPEFPNNVYHPALLKERGVALVERPWDRFYDSVTPRTKLVVMSAMNYSTGFRPPLEAVSRFLKERGVLFYVDGTQGAGAFTIDLPRVDPDLLAVHGYKWMNAPNGIGFAYVAPRLRAWLPPTVVGWRSDHGWREVNQLNHGTPVLPTGAEKYEGVMLASALLCAFEASVDQFLEIGLAAIEARTLGLSNLLRARLSDLGATFADPGPSPIVAARWTHRDAGELATALKRERILVSARHGHLRLSTHFFNHEADVEHCLGQLAKLL